MSTQEQRKAWSATAELVFESNSSFPADNERKLAFAVVALVDEIEQQNQCRINPIPSRSCELGTHSCVVYHDKLASREKALRDVRALLRGVAGHWHTDVTRLIQIEAILKAELGE